MKSSIINYIENFDDKNYLFSLIEYISAPTIMNIKPATLVNFSKNKRDLKDIWVNHKESFKVERNIDFFELNCSEESCIVLFYNYKLLEKCICNCKNRMLEDIGYNLDQSLQIQLENLSHRYREGCPHEIGLFLGFPSGDVDAFIKNEGRNYLYCGYWKVYNDLKIALNIFKQYDASKKIIENNILRKCR